jgi:hypothetical protein
MLSKEMLTVKSQYDTPKRSRPNGVDLISLAGLSIRVFVNV